MSGRLLYNAPMKRYFNTLDALDRFTRELERHEPHCPNCRKNGQFVSHGFVYRQISMTRKVVVGKRIFCANRYGKTGCGTTRRLYLANAIPTLRYSAHHLTTFLCSLIARSTVQQAYQAATRTESPRNAYRWLRKLGNQLIRFRSGSNKNIAFVADRFKSRTRRLRLLLPTLQTLFSSLSANPCAHYQQLRQTAFI